MTIAETIQSLVATLTKPLQDAVITQAQLTKQTLDALERANRQTTDTNQQVIDLVVAVTAMIRERPTSGTKSKRRRVATEPDLFPLDEPNENGEPLREGKNVQPWNMG